MRNYRNSNLSCFINAMLVILVLLVSSCSVSEKLRSINSINTRKVEVVGAVDTSTKSSMDSLVQSATASHDSAYMQDASASEFYESEFFKTDDEGIVLIPLPAAIVTGRVSKIAERNGRVPLAFEIALPKDVIDSDWQFILTPKMYLRLNGTYDTVGSIIEKVYITGSAYRDRQIKGYERYASFLSSIKDTLPYINEFQLEYFLKRNIPQLYSLKEDTSYVTNGAYDSLYTAIHKRALEHYLVKQSAKSTRKKLSQRGEKFRKYVKNEIKREGINLDAIVEDTLIVAYDKVNFGARKLASKDSIAAADTIVPKIMASKNIVRDSAAKYYRDSIYAQKVFAIEELGEYYEEKGDNYDIKKELISYNKDTALVYLKYMFTQEIKTRPLLDQAKIELSGEVYDGEKVIYRLDDIKPLTYDISSISSFVDTTIVRYKIVINEVDRAESENYKIEFKLGDATIRDDLGDNREEKKKIRAKLKELINDGKYVLETVTINATASPEGTVASNTKHARNRSISMANLFNSYVREEERRYNDSISEINKAIDDPNTVWVGLSPEEIDSLKNKERPEPFPDIKVVTASEPENWWDLDYYVESDSTLTEKEKEQYKSLEKVRDLDSREAQMRRHSYYKYVREKLYPKLRVVKFNFNMKLSKKIKVRVVTDELDSNYMRGVEALRLSDYETALMFLRDTLYEADYNTAVAYMCTERNLQACQVLERMERSFDAVVERKDSLGARIKRIGNDSALLALNPDIARYKRELDSTLIKSEEDITLVGKVNYLLGIIYTRLSTDGARNYTSQERIEFINKAKNCFKECLKIDYYNRNSTIKIGEVGSPLYYMKRAANDPEMGEIKRRFHSEYFLFWRSLLSEEERAEYEAQYQQDIDWGIPDPVLNYGYE